MISTFNKFKNLFIPPIVSVQIGDVYNDFEKMYGKTSKKTTKITHQNERDERKKERR